ncbi:MAG: SUMF1/EgtB/PvdO family nonheme iron enzyme [Cyanobacteria bacterium P01_F01_bin.143]
MAKNWAICIGINYYENLTDLRFAMRDAECMKDWFENEANFEKVYLFTDNSPPITDGSQSFSSQPSYGRLIRFLESRFNNKFLSIEDNLWFFFSGHGIRYGDRDYLMLSDSSVIGDLIEKTGIAFNYVTERLKRSGAGNVIFITDACRNEGASKGLGVGEERYQGVISIASCSPSERSFELEEKQQGSFTYALLESLRITGPGNCAVVERLDQRLRQRVPELTRQYKKQQQTPYIIAEPIAKTNLILLPSQATLKDVSALRDEAYRAENNQDLELATIFMTQILIASPADPDALAWFKRTWSEELKYKHKAEIRGLEKSHQGKIRELEQSFQSTIKQLEQELSDERSQAAQRLEEKEQSLNQQLQEKEQLKLDYQKQKQELEQSFQSAIKQLEQELSEARSQAAQRLKEKEQSLNQQLQEKEQLKRDYQKQKQELEQSFQSAIKQLEQELSQVRSQSTRRLEEIKRLQRQNNAVTRPLSIHRRNFLKWARLGGASLVTAVVAREIFKAPPSVLIVKLESFEFDTVTINQKGEIIETSNKQAEFFKEDLGNGVILEMVSIPSGKFMMGTEDEEIKRLVKKFNWDGYRREKPQHEVTVQPFFIGKFQITQAQYQKVMGKNPSNFQDEDLPVEQVSWNDAVEFCQRLSKQTGKEYRLPSEAEWEYAARAGTTTPFYFGETITNDLANYRGTSTYANESKWEYREKTTTVGTFPPNAFGLYDMHGNVWEWCQDDWYSNYEGAPIDGTVRGSKTGSKKVIRGGSWVNSPSRCRSAYRNADTRDDRYSTLGFRVVCVASRTT